MSDIDATCWTMIHAAAAGDKIARDQFARLYEPIARTYFTTRWRQSSCNSTLDDAVQDVFVECFKDRGILEKVSAQQPSDFRLYFHGVLRNIALRHESNRRSVNQLNDLHPADETSLSVAFDRAWARSLLAEAARIQAENAATNGERALKRIELLRLRFHNGLPIRDIAVQWNEDPSKLHHEYATARDEFRAALRQVVAFHLPNASDAELDSGCKEILSLLK